MLRKLGVVALVLLCAGMAPAREKYQQRAAVRLDREGERWAERTLGKLSLEQKIGQMLMIWARAEFVNVASPDYQRLRDAIDKYHLGAFGLTVPAHGSLLLKSEPYEAAALINQLQRDSEDVPLILAADFERGLSMRLNGATGFPAAMAFGAAGKTEYAEAFGRITAEEARAIGVQWNFFPVADVNSAPANPIINTRAFGEDAQQVSELVAAYLKGARAAGMLTTAKHFPGHGDTETDSHLATARVGGDRTRLDAVELPPFRSAIAAGVDSVMVAHVTVPALEPNPDLVASTSPAVINGLLRKELGFQGLVLTDALDMNALMKHYANRGGTARAAVDAVKAGNDMIIIPLDLDAAYNGLLTAGRSGEIPQAQIDASVLKILRLKASVGLHKAKYVDLEALPRRVANPESLVLAQQIADEAVTLIKDNGRVLPLAAAAAEPGTNGRPLPYTKALETRNRLVAVVVTDDVRGEEGRVLERQLRARAPDVNVMFIDARTAAGSSAAVMAAADQADAVLVAAYVTASAGRVVRTNGELKGSASLQPAAAALVRALLERAAEKTVLLAMGNPYLATEYPIVQTYLCTFSNAPVSEISAVRALFGEIPIRGRLPVTIPGVARRGDGIARPARVVEGDRNNVHGAKHTGR